MKVFFDTNVYVAEALLGEAAIRMGKPIEYDGQKGEITNHPDTAKLIAPSPREGWKL